LKAFALEQIESMNKSEAQLSAVVLRVERVFKGYLKMKPSKNFLEEHEMIK
jgi:hypothetical protein